MAGKSPLPRHHCAPLQGHNLCPRQGHKPGRLGESSETRVRSKCARQPPLALARDQPHGIDLRSYTCQLSPPRALRVELVRSQSPLPIPSDSRRTSFSSKPQAAPRPKMRAIFVLGGLFIASAATAPLADLGEEPRTFEWTLTWEKFAPDGFARDMILVNGEFPGPELELNENDYVEVLVHNRLPFNTTIHYHGMCGLRRTRNKARTDPP